MSSHAITLKSETDIEALARGGAILSQALDLVSREALPGVTPQALDRIARDFLASQNCVPSFLDYAPGGHDPFPAALCVSVNSGIVHGLPSDVPLALGDVVGLDLGLVYEQRYFLDSARTIIVGGDGTPEAQELLTVTREALERGIAAAVVGNYTGDIGYAISKDIEASGFGMVRELVGHGVGFAVHESPQVPNFGTPGRGEILEAGMVLAIEPMVTIGSPRIATADDGWTVVTASGELAAHFEHTVAVTEAGPRILTVS